MRVDAARAVEIERLLEAAFERWGRVRSSAAAFNAERAPARIPRARSAARGPCRWRPAMGAARVDPSGRG